MEKPDVDRIDGIAPAIAIRQKNSIRNPRSTVGTTTEIHDYMRLLFARAGRTFCRNCGREVVRETAEVVAAQLGGLPERTRLLLGFNLQVVEAPAAGPGETPSDVDELNETGERSRCRVRRRRVPASGTSPRQRCRRGRDGDRIAATERLRPPADRRPGGRVRRCRCRGAGRPADAAGDRRSRAAGRRRNAPAAHRLDRNRLSRRRRGGVGGAARRRPPSHRSCTSSRSGSSAARAASPTRIRSRACSRSTIPSARVRPVTGSATSSSSTWRWSCPDQTNQRDSHPLRTIVQLIAQFVNRFLKQMQLQHGHNFLCEWAAKTPPLPRPLSNIHPGIDRSPISSTLPPSHSNFACCLSVIFTVPVAAKEWSMRCVMK